MEHLDIIGLLKALQKLERNATVSLMYSGLRVPQFRLLDALQTMGQATVTELSEQLGITRATASVTVNELLRAGVVASIEHPGDRRSFHVQLTEIGFNKLHVARSDLAVLQDKVSRKYSAQTIELINAFSASMQ